MTLKTRKSHDTFGLLSSADDPKDGKTSVKPVLIENVSLLKEYYAPLLVYDGGNALIFNVNLFWT
jgi:hypothetical protein